jgi:hypothetical protein
MAQEVAGLRKGDRVELVALPDGQDYESYGVPAGCLGAVDFIDSQRTIHVNWDTGRRLGVLAEHHSLIRRTHRGG